MPSEVYLYAAVMLKCTKLYYLSTTLGRIHVRERGFTPVHADVDFGVRRAFQCTKRYYNIPIRTASRKHYQGTESVAGYLVSLRKKETMLSAIVTSDGESVAIDDFVLVEI